MSAPDILAGPVIRPPLPLLADRRGAELVFGKQGVGRRRSAIAEGARSKAHYSLRCPRSDALP